MLTKKKFLVVVLASLLLSSCNSLPEVLKSADILNQPVGWYPDPNAKDAFNWMQAFESIRILISLALFYKAVFAAALGEKTYWHYMRLMLITNILTFLPQLMWILGNASLLPLNPPFTWDFYFSMLKWPTLTDAAKSLSSLGSVGMAISYTWTAIKIHDLWWHIITVTILFGIVHAMQKGTMKAFNISFAMVFGYLMLPLAIWGLVPFIGPDNGWLLVLFMAGAQLFCYVIGPVFIGLAAPDEWELPPFMVVPFGLGGSKDVVSITGASDEESHQSKKARSNIIPFVGIDLPDHEAESPEDPVPVSAKSNSPRTSEEVSEEPDDVDSVISGSARSNINTPGHVTERDDEVIAGDSLPHDTEDLERDSVSSVTAWQEDILGPKVSIVAAQLAAKDIALRDDDLPHHEETSSDEEFPAWDLGPNTNQIPAPDDAIERETSSLIVQIE